MIDIEKEMLRINLDAEKAVRKELQQFCGWIADRLGTLAETIGLLL